MDLDTFWTGYGRFADIIAPLSLGIGIWTLFTAHGAKKAVKARNDSEQYSQEIDMHIQKLESIYKSVHDDQLYNENVLIDISNTLDTLTIQYKTVVKSFHRVIVETQKLIDDASENITKSPDYNKNKLTKQLNKVIQHLKKAKKEL